MELDLILFLCVGMYVCICICVSMVYLSVVQIQVCVSGVFIHTDARRCLETCSILLLRLSLTEAASDCQVSAVHLSAPISSGIAGACMVMACCFSEGVLGSKLRSPCLPIKYSFLF